MTNLKDKREKKKKKKSKSRKNIYDSFEKNLIFKNSQYIVESLSINLPYWITMGICIYILTKYSTKNYTFVEGIISFLIAIYSGYSVHYTSHTYDFGKIYQNSTNPIILYLKSFENINYFIENFILYVFDFHDKIHHDSTINKKPHLIFIEFIQNLITTGGLLAWFVYISNFHLSFNNTTFRFNPASFLLWGMIYATVHNINFLFHENEQHVKHHIDPCTNYALDIVDIIFDTKYDLENIENFNWDGCVNGIIITALMIYFNIDI